MNRRTYPHNGDDFRAEYEGKWYSMTVVDDAGIVDGFVRAVVPALGGLALTVWIANESSWEWMPGKDPDADYSPRIYIAGPFRADTPWLIERNIREAEALGLDVGKLGGIPIIPHTMYRFFQNALPDAFWLEAGLSILRTCHAVAVVGGKHVLARSSGTRGEVAAAERRHQPVFYAPYEGTEDAKRLATWIEAFKKEQVDK